jgi:hypothetical protein
VTGPLKARLRGQPDQRGYFLAGFATLERRSDEERAEARGRVQARLARIGDVARQTGARVVVLLVPAPVEVCAPQDLEYFPRNVSLSDDRFDADGPRRTTEAIAAAQGFGYVDLLPVLRASHNGCPYQPGNLHWLDSGHELVATHMATWLQGSGLLAEEQ